MIRNTSIALLIAANLLPVFGVLFWDWSVFSIIFLFWCENVVIGLLGIARTAMSASIFLGAFFLVHYGGFMMGHLMVIFALFADNAKELGGFDSGLPFFLSLFDPITVLAIIGLFVSHGWSFAENFIGKKEYQAVSGLGAMGLAYKRMVVTHVALIAGGFVLTKWNEPLAGLLMLLGLKIAMDLFFHRREHEKLSITV